ncbi:MAG TPA: MYXO-CTERM sorting domain-containing protein, partial [Polyangiales bacterium]|nr:MYXO-CTERM sorting domain-containing protein [Polyangiales bacterium]
GTATGEKPTCTVGPLVGGQTTESTSSDAGTGQEAPQVKEDDGCALTQDSAGGWLALLMLGLLARRRSRSEHRAA